MKRSINNILLGASMLLVVSSCSPDELPLAGVLENTEFGIALRSIVETNGLDLSDLSSSYTNQFELDAVDGGFEPGSIRVLVGFSDDDESKEKKKLADGTSVPVDPANSAAPTVFSTSFDVDSFNETTTVTTHGLPVGTFSATLTELLNHLGLVAGDYDRGDVIDIEFEIIATDGTVFNKTNVGSNVAAAGRFSFYNSPFEFTAMIDDPKRIVLSKVSLADFGHSSLIEGDTDTVLFDFDGKTIDGKDFKGNFVTLPTIARKSVKGNTDDSWTTTLIPYIPVPVDTTRKHLFYFLYTAGGALADTISFIISGAESTDGFPMDSVTFKNAFIIDNDPPGIKLGGAGTRLTSETGGEIKAITVDIIFTEEVTGKVTFTVASPTGQFDSQDIVVGMKGEASETASFEFQPLSGGKELAKGPVDFTATASGTDNKEGIDEAGKAVEGTIPIRVL